MAMEHVPYNGPIVTREMAIKAGSKYYFTRVLCPHGHMAERLTSDCACRTCKRLTWLVWAEKNKARIAARKLVYNKANREKVAAGDKARHEANREKRLQQQAALRARTKVERQEKWREWALLNPEKARANSVNRQARQRGAEGSHTADDLKAIFKAQNGKCAYCKVCLKKQPHQVDHIQPLVSGGTNYARNLQFLCAPCNRSKSSKDPIEYAQRLGMLL